MTDRESFSAWLKAELEERGWSYSDLARYSGVTPASITQIIDEARRPGLEITLGIATALEAPPQIDYRRTAPSPPRAESTLALDLLLAVASRLSDGDLDRLLAIARALHGRAREESGD